MSAIAKTICDVCGSTKRQGQTEWIRLTREGLRLCSFGSVGVVDNFEDIDLCPTCAAPVLDLIRSEIDERGKAGGRA